MSREERGRAEAELLQKALPPGSVVLYDRLEDRTTVVVNSGPWYPGKGLDLYRLAKLKESAPVQTP